MNAIVVIEMQHLELRREIDRLRHAPVYERGELLARLSHLLEAHAVMEEKVFYPCFQAAALGDYLDDHEQIHRFVARMLHAPLDDPRFPLYIEVLSGRIFEHAHVEEEARLLPLVGAVLTSAELDALGDEMLELYRELVTPRPDHEHRPAL